MTTTGFGHNQHERFRGSFEPANDREIAAPRPATTVTHVGGMRFAAQVRSHTVFTDQRLTAGGSDLAPNPVELLGVALASCISFHIHQFYWTRRLPTEGLGVGVAHWSTESGTRTMEFRVRVVLPDALPERFIPMLDKVVRSCPVYRSLAPGTKIDVDIVNGSDTHTYPGAYRSEVESSDNRS